MELFEGAPSIDMPDELLSQDLFDAAPSIDVDAVKLDLNLGYARGAARGDALRRSSVDRHESGLCSTWIRGMIDVRPRHARRAKASASACRNKNRAHRASVGTAFATYLVIRSTVQYS